MHEKLLKNQKDFSEKSREQMKAFTAKPAKDIGLDVDKFRSDFGKERCGEIIDGDKKLGQELGVEGIPTFLINGTFVNGNISYEKFRSLVREHLVEARKLLQNGVDPQDIYRRAVRQNQKEDTEK